MRRVSGSARLRLAAVLLEVAAALLVVYALLHGYGLRISFEPSPQDSYRADVGSRLLTQGWLALAIALAGFVVGGATVAFTKDTDSERRWRPRGHAVMVATALAAIALVAAALVTAGDRLSPSFDRQRAAVAALDLPDGAHSVLVRTTVADALEYDASFALRGRSATVCPGVVAALRRWADDGTVTPDDHLAGRFDLRARRGSDTVRFDCATDVRAGAVDSTFVDLTLTGPR